MFIYSHVPLGYKFTLLRGTAKGILEDYYGAIADYTKAIEVDPNYAFDYNNRGIVKKNIGDLNGACSDWRIGARMGNTLAQDNLRKFCN